MPTLTRKGQITVPKAIRHALGLVPGSQVEFVLESGQVVLRKQITPEIFQRWQGYLRGKLPVSVDEFLELLRGERLAGQDEPQ